MSQEELRDRIRAELAKELESGRDGSPEAGPPPPSGEANFFRHPPNTPVLFDLNDDGEKEEIVFDTVQGELRVKGHPPVSFEVNGPGTKTDYFLIVRFHDRFGTKMNMVGFVTYDPNTPSTNLFALVAPRGQEVLSSVGVVPGELVTPSMYDESEVDDFAHKAVLIDGQGIEAPVPLTVLPMHSWYGRNLFTYYSTYVRLVDNISPYGRDYRTSSELRTVRPVTVYQEKDKSSASYDIGAGVTVRMKATDNEAWIRVEWDGTPGGAWLHASDVSSESFEGFIMFG